MSNGEYFTNLCAAMAYLAEQRNTTFLGQSVKVPGTAMFQTLCNVAQEKLIELPVIEDCQMGMAIGMSLQGYIPICCYPRINFLLLAVNQLVNHLDKIPLYSNFRPKVIIRTSIGTHRPLDPGPQHLGDYTAALAMMVNTIDVVKIRGAGDIMPQYKMAYARTTSTILVEEMSEYG